MCFLLAAQGNFSSQSQHMVCGRISSTVYTLLPSTAGNFGNPTMPHTLNVLFRMQGENSHLLSPILAYKTDFADILILKNKKSEKKIIR